MNRSNSVPLCQDLKNEINEATTSTTNRNMDKNLYGIEECSHKSLFQLNNNKEKENLVRIQSQLSIENSFLDQIAPNQNSNNKNHENHSNIESIFVPPRLVSGKINQDKTDPYRVIKITEIIEINNKSNKQHNQLKQEYQPINRNNRYNDSNICDSNSVRTIQNTNYKISPNGSFYEVNNEQIYSNPAVELVQNLDGLEPDMVDLMRRNECLENEIKLMKDKFKETQLILEQFKLESTRVNLPDVSENDEKKQTFVPVVHNFSFMKHDTTVSSSGLPKRVFVKVIGRTRSQSNDKQKLTYNVNGKNITLDNANLDCETCGLEKNEPIYTNKQPPYKNNQFKNTSRANEISEGECYSNQEQKQHSNLEAKYLSKIFDSESNTKDLRLSTGESLESKRFDLDKFKFCLKQLNSYENCSASSRSSSMPANQLRNDHKLSPEDLKYRPKMVGIKPTIKNSRPLKSSLIPKSMNSPTGNSFDTTSSFCTNQHMSLVKNAGEIINHQKSAFISVSGGHNTTTSKQLNSILVNDNDKINDKLFYKAMDEEPNNQAMSPVNVTETDNVWSYRINQLSSDTQPEKRLIKNYESLKKPNLVTSQKSDSSSSTSSYSCGLLNKFFISDQASKCKQLSVTNTGKVIPDKENNTLYREEDENYDKNNSPSLSVASTDADNFNVFNINEPLKQKPYATVKDQESTNSQQKILTMIEDYLNKNAALNYSNSESSLQPKKGDESSTTSSTKKVTSYYNQFYKDQLNNNSTSNINTQIDDCSTENQISGIGFVSKYIDEEDYSDEYNDLIKSSPNEEIKEMPDLQQSLSTFLTNKTKQESSQINDASLMSNRTPRQARRVIFADEVNE